MTKLNALFLLAAVGLVGCAASPADDGAADELPSVDDGDVTPQAPSTPGATPIIILPPLCLPPSADTIKNLPGPLEQTEAVGRATASDVCDRFVMQLEGTLGGDIGLWVDVYSPASQGVTIPDQATCNASRLSSLTRGQLPNRWVFQNGQFVLVAGAWETIESFTEYGVWSGSACTFPSTQGSVNLSGGSASRLLNSPYVRIQMSTRGIFKTAAGDVSSWMRSRAIRNDS
jgi:hypothetical protein